MASRRWNFWVNHVAAHPLLGYRARAAMLRAMGLDISPDAYEIGARCYIHSAALHVGSDTRINDGCWFENVAPIRFGNGVGIGPQVTIITSAHDLGTPALRAGAWSYHGVEVRDGSWVGARSTLLPGVTIAEGCVVAAGAVVTRDTEPNGLYGGVPARRLRNLDCRQEADPAAS